MWEEHELGTSTEHILDEEVASAIRYLDPDRNAERSVDETGTFLTICISMLVLLVGGLAYVWFYLRTF